MAPGVNVQPRPGLDDERLVRRAHHDRENVLAERTNAAQGLGRCWRDNDLALKDRLIRRGPGRQAKDASRKGDFGLIGIGRAMAHGIDHASPASFTVGTAFAP